MVMHSLWMHAQACNVTGPWMLELAAELYDLAPQTCIRCCRVFHDMHVTSNGFKETKRLFQCNFKATG